MKEGGWIGRKVGRTDEVEATRRKQLASTCLTILSLCLSEALSLFDVAVPWQVELGGWGVG